MEKTIRWDQTESVQMTGIDNERTKILAQIGSLMMDLEQARKMLDSLNERHKVAIQQALTNHGVNQFESARPINGGVILQLSDSPAQVNGGASDGR